MRTALVTGASRGIGRAIAVELSRRGWQLFLVAQHEDRLVKAAKELSSVLGSVAMDLGSGEAAAVKVGEAFSKVGSSLDLLVLNAGIFIEEALAEVGADTFKRNMSVNLDANLFLVKHLLPFLRSGTRPRIVLTGSTAAYEAYPLVPTYGVAKWALRGLAVNLRHELMSDRIGVTLVSPGGTLTDMWAGEDLPPGRLLEPRDIGVLVAAVTDLSEQAVVEEIIVRPMLGDIHE